MGAIICALMCGVDVFLIACVGPNPVNVGAAIFCGLLAVICAIWEAS
jgi:hypothetical protein